MILYFYLGLVLIIQLIRCDPACISPSGAVVDWWITLKLNGGDEYAYCDAVSCDKIASSGKFINDANNSAVLRTLKQIEKGVNLPSTTGYLLWNDDPPNGMNATTTNAHAKGFIGFGKTSGFLVVHSTPEFPWLDDNLEQIKQHIDDSQQIYGQHYLCTTTTTENLEAIACGYNIDNPKVYFGYIPTFAPLPCLNQMVANKRNTKTMSLVIPYQTLGGVTFTKFSKSLSNNTPLYEKVVAPYLKAGLLVQSWGRPYEGPTCTGYKVLSNTRVKIEGAPEFKDSQDHSKYGISLDSTLPFVCLGDINRMRSQWTRGGGTVCIKDQNLHKQFTKILRCVGCLDNLGYKDVNNVCDTSCLQCVSMKCDPICRTCKTENDPNGCTSCEYGFYLNGTNCLPCKSPCADCINTESICNECVDGYKFYRTQCKLDCDPSCSTCTAANSPDSCLTCPPGKYLKDNKCLDCISPCTQCSNGDTKSCSACIKDYQLVGNECQPMCHSSCLTCSQPNNPKECLKCSSDKYLTATKECLSCKSPCSSCKDSETNCTGCVINYTLNGQNCSPNCDSSCATCQNSVDVSSCLTCNTNSFLSGGKCLLCKAPCASCVDNPQKCNSCIHNFTLQGNQCIINSQQPTDTCHSTCQSCTKNNDPQGCSDCPYSFYLTSGNECQPCTSPCSNCSGQSTNCTGCIENHKLNGSSCEFICDSSCKTCSQPANPSFCTSCLNGTYLSQGKCLRCKAPCLNCLDAEDKCSSCIDNYTLSGNTCSLTPCHSSCLTCSSGNNKNKCLTCEKNYYLSSQNECLLCDSPCESCSGSATNCVTCLPNYTFKSSKCEPICDSSCFSCLNPADPQSCLTCNDGTYLNQKTCLRCKPPCQNCVGQENICTSCIDRFTLKGNQCSMNTCHSSCFTCSDSTQNGCTSCIKQQFLSKNKECLPCKAPCQECLNQENLCTSCQLGYVLKGNECMEKSKVKDENTTYIKQIIKCHPLCDTCFGKKYDQCLTCPQNRILQKTYSKKTQKCICPEGTTDKKQPMCEKNSLQENLVSTTKGFFGTSVGLSTLTSIASSNPVMILSYADFAQTISAFTYVNQDYAYDYDSSLQTMYIANINFPVKGISPSKSSSRFRNLAENDDQMVEEDNSNGNPKLFMNDRHPYFITNAMIILIIISLSWIISYLCSHIQNTTTIKDTLRKVFYQSFPLILFVFTVQELCVLAFFQYQQMEFSTGLEVLSSFGSILALMYTIIISGYIFTSIEKLNYLYMPISPSPDVSPTNVKNMSKIIPSASIPTLTRLESMKNSKISNFEIQDLSEKFYYIRQIFKQEQALSRHFPLIIVTRKIITALVTTFCYLNPIAQSVILFINYGIYFFLTLIIRPFNNIKFAIFSGVIETITFLMHIFLIIMISTDEGSDFQLLFSLVQIVSSIIVSCLYTIVGLVLFIKNQKKYDSVIYNQQQPMQSRSQLDILDQSQSSPAKKHINHMNFNNQHFFRQNDNNQTPKIIQNNDITPVNNLQIKQTNNPQDLSFSAVSNLPSQLIKLEGAKREDSIMPQNSAMAINGQSNSSNQGNNNQSNNSSINHFVTNFGKNQTQQTHKK